jgi:TRAP-type uncharacterized transport system substrate-binding protein
MSIDDLALLSRRDRIRGALVIAVLVALVVTITVQFTKPAPPRRIVLASGAAFGVYHRYAQRYQEMLARDGVTVEERMTSGAAENLRLLRDPGSSVDVAFLQGGIEAVPPTDLVMIASLYYEPVWIFYRDAKRLTQIKQLAGKRIAVGAAGSGTHALADQLLAANDLTVGAGIGRGNTDIVAIGGNDALTALKAGEVDATLFVGSADTEVIRHALLDPVVEVMSLDRADAYPRRFAYLTKLTLPRGTIDLGVDIPRDEVKMIATQAMLAGREDLHPALINLLYDAATEIHSKQGIFEAAGEFPKTTQVDIPVSPAADRHHRFGPSLLYRYLPFWVASVVERTIILLVPLAVILIPCVNYLPELLRWRIRSRIFRWYGELALLERDIGSRQGSLPIAKWLEDLERIERAVGSMRAPARFASEVYTLREHIALVRHSVLSKDRSRAESMSDPELRR